LQVQASIEILAKKKYTHLLPIFSDGNSIAQLHSLVDSILPFKDLSLTEAISLSGESIRSLLSEGLKLAIFFNEKAIMNSIVNFAMKQK